MLYFLRSNTYYIFFSDYRYYRVKVTGFPLRLENLEKWESIFQSGNFEQTGKVGENDTKYWKIQEISEKILSVIFSDI